MIPINAALLKTNIYFIQAECCDLIKIGWSHSVERRLLHLQRFSACKLKLLAVRSAPISTEHDYHLYFREHRVHGEWFRPHPDILAEIAEINGAAESAEQTHWQRGAVRSWDAWIQGLYAIAAGNGPDAMQARNAISRLTRADPLPDLPIRDTQTIDLFARRRRA